MADRIFNLPGNSCEHILRKTGEKVEIIDFDAKERGDRSDEDWVTYIDSSGNEHIKEHLNIQLDFKPVVNDAFNKLLNSNWNKDVPTTRNNRIFEVAKALLLDSRGYGVSASVNIAKSLVDKVGIENIN